MRKDHREALSKSVVGNLKYKTDNDYKVDECSTNKSLSWMEVENFVERRS